MITERLQKQKDRTEAMIEASSLGQEEKDDYIDLLTLSLAGTNGLSSDQKLQNVSEVNFGLVRLFCQHIVDSKKDSAKSWRETIVKCKRELMWFGLGVIALLMLHPQIVQIVKEFTK